MTYYRESRAERRMADVMAASGHELTYWEEWLHHKWKQAQAKIYEITLEHEDERGCGYCGSQEWSFDRQDMLTLECGDCGRVVRGRSQRESFKLLHRIEFLEAELEQKKAEFDAQERLIDS